MLEGGARAYSLNKLLTKMKNYFSTCVLVILHIISCELSLYKVLKLNRDTERIRREWLCTTHTNHIDGRNLAIM